LDSNNRVINALPSRVWAAPGNGLSRIFDDVSW
jgi:hypothetical protein